MDEIAQNCKKFISSKIYVLLLISMKIKKLNIDYTVREVLLKANNFWPLYPCLFNYK